jgi:glyoxylase I family protein
MKIEFLDHIVLIVKNVKKTVKFYSKFLGKPIHKGKFSVAYQIGKTKLFLVLPYKNLKNNKFNADRIGLNHLAFGVRTLQQLRKMKNKLDKLKIKNSGIKIDKYGKKEFIWFDDPDKIRLEFYLREK